jgi:hypothetical protein
MQHAAVLHTYTSAPCTPTQQPMPLALRSAMSPLWSACSCLFAATAAGQLPACIPQPCDLLTAAPPPHHPTPPPQVNANTGESKTDAKCFCYDLAWNGWGFMPNMEGILSQPHGTATLGDNLYVWGR